MGEGILIYGVGGSRRRYTKDLQSFADRVLARGRGNNSLYVFGRVSKVFLSSLARKGVQIKTFDAAITDKTILKYKNHPKKRKGAVVSFHRFRMVEKAVKKPKNVYIDLNRKRLVYVASVKYSPSKVLKVVIDPNQRFGSKYFHNVVSIGVVDKNNMRTKQYQKIK